MKEVKSIKVSEILIKNRFRKDYGDIESLAKSIQELGLLQPIGVSQDNVLIFGERRILAIKSLGWEYIPAITFSFDDILSGEYAENEIRKDFTISERLAIGKAMEEELTKRHGGDRKSEDFQEGKISTLNETGKSRDLVAERVGMGSGKTYESAKKVLDSGIPELVELMDKKEVSIHSASKIADFPEEEQEEIIEEIKEKEDKPSEIIKKHVHVAQNSGNNEWYTPSVILESARNVLGEIECDPASSDIANQNVKAKIFYTIEDDGLKRKWGEKVWMNPPYAQPAISLFSQKLVEKLQTGEVKEAIVLVNNATETGWFQRMGEICSSICFPSGRIRFVDPEGNPSGSPLQGQAIIYFGNNPEIFEENFNQFGLVFHR